MLKATPSNSSRIMNREDDENAYRKEKSPLLRLLGYFRYVVGLLILGLALAGVADLGLLLKPFVVQRILDDYVTVENFDFTAITFLGILYFVVTLVSAGAQYIQAQVSQLMGQKIIHRMRTQLFDHIQKMNMTFFDHHSSGSLLTRILSDIESVSEFFSVVVISFIQQIFLLIGIVFAMLQLDLQLTLVSAILVPIICLVTGVYRWIAHQNFIQVKAQLSRLNSFLSENITGMRVVQLFHREKEKFQEFHALDERYYHLGFREILLNSFGGPFMTTIGNVASAVLIVVFTNSVVPSAVDTGVKVGVLYAFITLMQQFFRPISEIADQFTTIQSAFVSTQRIFKILDNTEEMEDLEKGELLEKVKGDIRFEHVWFAYQGEEWVLKDVSFHISPGQQVAFVGATGSGKSTIISLLARFYTIQKGRILLDGKPIEEYQLTSLRQHVAVVMQDVFLFSGDVAGNIRLGNQNISDEQVQEAGESIGADEFIQSLPRGYHSTVVERGATFSAGQRQLISFARAMAFAPEILILDEATASIDTETEQLIDVAMERAAENRTMLIVAHRLSTIRKADCIYVLDYGVLLERGTHEQLLEQKGRYYQLWQESLQEAAIEDSK